MMAPKFEEKIVGHAEVRALFKISSVGTIAGSYVTDGKIVRNSSVKVSRDGKEIFTGKIATVKRGKDDAKEVSAGYECGIKIDGFNDVQEGDIIECIVKEQIFS
jgi:translation initiation factor IF-2